MSAWCLLMSWLCFYQTRLAWFVDQGSNKNHSPAYNFAPTVTKFCVMWEGLSLPHDTKFGNCRCKTVVSRVFPSWSLIHGLRWSGLIKAKPGTYLVPGHQQSSWWHTLNRSFISMLPQHYIWLACGVWLSKYCMVVADALMPIWYQAPVLSNQISLIHGSRIN